MNTHSIKYLLLALVLLLTAPVSFAQQLAGGIRIDYAPVLQENPEKARAWTQKMSPELQKMIVRFQVFEAPGIQGLNEVRLLKFEYTNAIRGTIDDSANETVANIARLPGVRNATQGIVRVAVSGLDARRVSFESDRYDGKLGAEFLIVQSPQTRTMYQLQVIFSKKKGMNILGSLTLEAERAEAEKLMRSVRIEALGR